MTDAGVPNPLDDATAFGLRPLPALAARILLDLAAPPRLVAHLVLVHDVAAHLLDELAERGLDGDSNADDILFGAATHDIGKVLHPRELSAPGREHERDGPSLLIAQGVPPARARFARTHGTWVQDIDITTEDLLVALADTCWKGKRDEALEERMVEYIAAWSGRDYWDIFIDLDGIVENIAHEAERRLAWQRQFPVF